HTMKLWERVIERRLRRESIVSENQFGFMPGRSTTKAIHSLISLMEKYRKRQRDLHMAFLDLEKAYDSVPQSAERLNNRLESWRKTEDNGLRSLCDQHLDQDTVRTCVTKNIRGWSFLIYAGEHYHGSDGYDYPPSAYILEGDGDDGDYDYAPAASEVDGDDDDGDYDYAPAA
nr:retrovirus-related Pol polyprotein LINE-1 [Tanacetum cinerariifolium]